MLSSLLLAWLAQAAAAPAPHAASLSVAPRRLDDAASSDPDVYGPPDPYAANFSFYARVAGLPSPPYPPMPPGGYDPLLLCPPQRAETTVDLITRGAVDNGVCLDTSSVTSFAGAFANSGPFDGPLQFDAGMATSVESMFTQSGYNQAISLDLGRVVTTRLMFSGNKGFNSPLSLGLTQMWTQTDWMFNGAEAFNQPLDLGDSSNVQNFQGTFANARNFNQPMTTFSTASATTMHQMLQTCQRLNQPLDFDTSKVRSMYSSLRGTSALAQELDAWDVGAVTEWRLMFKDSRISAEAVPGGIGFGRACRIHHSWKAQTDTWDPVSANLVANVSELDLSLCAPHLRVQPSYMFSNVHSFNDPVTFNTSSALSTAYMFNHAFAFNQPVDHLVTATVITFEAMFRGAKAFNQRVGGWDTSSATTMNQMFYGASSFAQELEVWNVGAVTDLTVCSQFRAWPPRRFRVAWALAAPAGSTTRGRSNPTSGIR